MHDTNSPKKPRIFPSIVAWNSAVSACARAGQWQRAFRLLGDLEGMTLEADVTCLGV